MADGLLPPLSTTFEPTRTTLHAYAHGVGAIPRTLGEHHPKWWHVSLNVTPTGLTTDAVAIPGGGTFWLRMDLRKHAVVLEKSSGESLEFSMTAPMRGADAHVAHASHFLHSKQHRQVLAPGDQVMHLEQIKLIDTP